MLKGFLTSSPGFWTIVADVCVIPRSGARSESGGMIYSNFCAFSSSCKQMSVSCRNCFLLHTFPFYRIHIGVGDNVRIVSS